MRTELTQEDLSLWFGHGISPVQAEAIKQAKREYADGKKEPSAWILRMVSAFGEDYVAEYLKTWRKLMDK